MPTSATSRSSDARRGARGFTLLELLVVLGILGLVTAMAAPPMLRSIESWRRQSELDAVLDQVRGLPARARATGRAITISDETLSGDEAPLRSADWRVTAPEAWQVKANGLCAGGTLRLAAGELERVVEVAAPFCEPRLAGED
jgi:prepilin-type N-terminal cleavage/methylation domain-containing protein